MRQWLAWPAEAPSATRIIAFNEAHAEAIAAVRGLSLDWNVNGDHWLPGASPRINSQAATDRERMVERIRAASRRRKGAA